jgi:hypothetical protein
VLATEQLGQPVAKHACRTACCGVSMHVMFKEAKEDNEKCNSGRHLQLILDLKPTSSRY